MHNNSETTVEAIASRMVDRFGVEMDIYQVSENCMETLNDMGMLVIGKKGIAGRASDQMLRLPVDCFEPLAVYRMPNTWENLTNSLTITIQDIVFPVQKIFVPVPNSDSDIQLVDLPDQVLHYLPHLTGPYIDYTWEPPFLKFNEVEPGIIAIFSTIPVDKDTGLAKIPFHAFKACLYNCLYIYYQPLFLQGKVAEYVWREIAEWRRRTYGQAEKKVGMQKLSQNEMSKVHNVMSSFDRKRYRLDS